MPKSRNQEIVLTELVHALDAEILEQNAEIDLVQRLLAANEEESKVLQIRLLNSLLKACDRTTDEKGEIRDFLMAEVDRVKNATKVADDYTKDLTKRLRYALEKQASSSQSMVDNKGKKN